VAVFKYVTVTDDVTGEAGGAQPERSASPAVVISSSGHDVMRRRAERRLLLSFIPPIAWT